jgi:hypothetical protein
VLQVERRFLSEPAEVLWAGFRSDTYRLQQAGWELAAEEDVMYNRIRLLMRHRDMRLYALSDDVEYQYRRLHDRRERPLAFHVVRAAHEFREERIVGRGSMFAGFKQIDAQPQFIEREIKSIEDFKIFATPLARTEELIVEPETVAELLDKIRKMQAPEQARLRAKEARIAAPIEIHPRTTFHAQIISLTDHRKAA